MMVAIPELDGATAPMVFGGRSSASGADNARDMRVHPERAARLAERVARLVALRRTPKAERRLGVVLFNFPPNSGATGSAAFLSVYASLLNTLKALKADGYDVAVPESADALRQKILGGNAERYGTPANVHARIAADDHVAREPHLTEIEAQWGPAPAATRATARAILVLGASSATSSSGCSRPSATRATRCGSCSSRVFRRPTPSRPSTAGCARTFAPTRSCISARTGRSNSCPASRPGCPPPAGPSG